MTRVAIIGRGWAGSAIRSALEKYGAQAVTLSRSTGFDAMRPVDLAEFGHFDAVVEATSTSASKRDDAIEFFTTSTRNIAGAAAEMGARHVLLSIVNCDAPDAQAYGYYAGKAAQERAARDVADEADGQLTIVRTTQWFEFAQQMSDRMRSGPLTFLPKMRTRPVALAAVADVIAQCCSGARAGEKYELCGPEPMWLRDMVKALPGAPFPVTVPLPGRAGHAFKSGLLMGGPDCEVVGPTFAQWLTQLSGKPA